MAGIISISGAFSSSQETCSFSYGLITPAVINSIFIPISVKNLASLK
jgi:hypothetical protein